MFFACWPVAFEDMFYTMIQLYVENGGNSVQNDSCTVAQMK